jgi:hypothetical protein
MRWRASALVNNANTVVAALADGELDQQASQALALLALVAGQDVAPAEGSDGTDGRWQQSASVHTNLAQVGWIFDIT